FNTSWEEIDVGWARLDAGFNLVKSLAGRLPETARTFLQRTEVFRSEVAFDAGTAALPYLISLRLAIRALSGLLPKRLDADEDIARLGRLIDYLPTRAERVGLWAEIALRYQICGRESD